MWVSRYFLEFILFSLLGWLWETLFCTFKGGKWENRGFLFGPICPIYGFGAVGGLGLVELLSLLGLPHLSWWQVALIALLGSAVLEYFTSWALEKLFHACWWDYSNMPLNVHGRICLPASLGFAAVGELVYYVLAPLTEGLWQGFPSALAEALALLFALLLGADLMMTVSALSGFNEKLAAAEQSFNEHMESAVETLYESSPGLWRHTVRRIRSFRYPHLSPEPLRRLLERFRRKEK